MRPWLPCTRSCTAPHCSCLVVAFAMAWQLVSGAVRARALPLPMCHVLFGLLLSAAKRLLSASRTAPRRPFSVTGWRKLRTETPWLLKCSTSACAKRTLLLAQRRVSGMIWAQWTLFLVPSCWRQAGRSWSPGPWKLRCCTASSKDTMPSPSSLKTRRKLYTRSTPATPQCARLWRRLRQTLTRATPCMTRCRQCSARGFAGSPWSGSRRRLRRSRVRPSAQMPMLGRRCWDWRAPSAISLK
mmetsp:Transcript_812/g.2435  ORF Transcript_812/g.2435 Transcript_812/m.2435 type:complete len:242 (+) Transcript_812:753-1478(+)